jgi:beta-galactosidase
VLPRHGVFCRRFYGPVRAGSRQDQLPGLLTDLVGATVEEWHSLPLGVTYALEMVGLEQACAVALWAEALRPVGAEVLACFAGEPLHGQPGACLNHIG